MSEKGEGGRKGGREGGREVEREGGSGDAGSRVPVLLLSSASSVVDEERTGKVRDQRRQGKGDEED